MVFWYYCATIYFLCKDWKNDSTKMLKFTAISHDSIQKIVGQDVPFCSSLFLLGDPSTLKEVNSSVSKKRVQTAVISGRRLISCFICCLTSSVNKQDPLLLLPHWHRARVCCETTCLQCSCGIRWGVMLITIMPLCRQWVKITWNSLLISSSPI